MTDGWGTVAAALIGFAGLFIGLMVGRRQTRDQAQVEHGQWLRGQRQEAYLTFLSAWDQAVKQIGDLWIAADRLEREVDNGSFQGAADTLQELRDTALFDLERSADQSLERVTMLGPETTDQAATDMRSSLKRLSGITEERLTWAGRAQERRDLTGEENRGSDPLHEWDDDGMKARQEFIIRVRQVLGTAPAPGA